MIYLMHILQRINAETVLAFSELIKALRISQDFGKRKGPSRNANFGWVVLVRAQQAFIVLKRYSIIEQDMARKD